jgi:catechol 2,3-dioxygenase-like lactoylglutathione lyase family enzyme
MLRAAKLIAFAPSKDLQRSRAFYEGTLGLRFVSEDKFAAVFDAAGIMLRVAAVPDFQPAPFTILGWRVSDIESTVRKLRAQSVRFERYNFLAQDDLGIWASPSGARVAWFKDPDGNLLSLTQFPGKSAGPGPKRRSSSSPKKRSQEPRRKAKR